MKRLRGILIFLPALCIFGFFNQPVFGQIGELDQLMENAEEKNAPEEGIKDKGGPSSEDAGWFAEQIKASGASEKEKEWADELKKFADKPNEQKIEGMKDLILKKFKISILEGPTDGGPKLTADSKNWKGAPWTLEQLQTIYETLDSLPESYVQYTKRINKFEAESSEVSVNGKTKTVAKKTYGIVHSDTPDLVNLFDYIFKDKRYSSSEKGQSKLKSVLIHEMAHCLQYSDDQEKKDPIFGSRQYARKWSQKFWIQVKEYTTGDNYPFKTEHANKNVLGVYWTAFSTFKFWERGQCVSIYGGVDRRLKGGKSYASIGLEDMAEACAFTACAPDLMRERFPKRYEHVMDNFLKGLGSKSSVPDINFNPRWYGYSETSILWAPPSGGLKSCWADIGVAGSFPEQYPEDLAEMKFFINEDEKEINSLNDSTARFLKDYVEF